MTKLYQTTMFASLDKEVELDPYIVTIDDPTWLDCIEELRTASWVCLDTEFYDLAALPRPLVAIVEFGVEADQ